MKKRTIKKPASVMVRVRMAASDHERLVRNAEQHDLDVSEYVRKACEKFEAIDNLYSQISSESERRALTSVECNVLLLMYPELFLSMGGVELARDPGNRTVAPR